MTTRGAFMHNNEANPRRDMLQEPNAYGIEDLFLMLRLHMSSCQLSIILPSDRGLTGSWLSNILLTFAITDLSMYDESIDNDMKPLQAQVDVIPSTYTCTSWTTLCF